ncbi:head processing protein [Citrobacter freundii]|uniref:head processing protein n=1 Tax=Citrobacter freundii TaxID=546 RepID=UPI002B242B6C|nr:head processing protein [Citrobacter freundii]MEB2478219.1 head processing protein [Citrobacter freundii]
MNKGLRTVTDRFSLTELFRKNTYQNGRQYLVSAVSDIFNSPETQERMKLGELYGFYGHGRREAHFNKTGSIRLPETSVIMVEGAPVVVDNVPSNRTLDISVSPDGIVSHTQEILDTPTGQIVNGMEKSQAGGWSWATKGGTQNGKAIIREYAGMDYVGIPNFLSLDRVALMTESAEDEQAQICAVLMENGMTEAGAVDVYHHFRKMRDGSALLEAAERATELELDMLAQQGQFQQIERALREDLASITARFNDSSKDYQAMMETARDLKAQRRTAVKAMLNNLPYHITDEQRNALIHMETGKDLEIVMALFESVSRSSVRDLPIAAHQHITSQKATVETVDTDPGVLSLDGGNMYSPMVDRFRK